MLPFQTIQLSDKPIFDRFLEGNPYRSSDLSFTNLYCWQEKFQTQFVVQDDWLFIRFQDKKGRNSYLKPIGKSKLADAINILEKDSVACNCLFQIRGLTQQMCEEVEAAMPGKFTYSLNRSVSDYLYTSEKLIHLSGKKLQSKRNHINRFKNENQWEYRSLTGNPEALAECKKMLAEWMEKDAREERDPSLVFDDIATNTMLDHFDYFGLRGGMICADNKLVAFSLGSPLTADTFDVHVEKAFTDTHGAYSIINQQLIEHEAAEFTYINREDDLGMDSLRKAKLSYQPDILLEKFVARKKEI
ncbi:MAG: phosphatidylglycerol lysyltransferase domain-containing protein [Dysgonamonadaceae bacterium]|jgi:hypothetical protein|nr:phosphatidylglycerol lysyltransferase domain-containing protein [Dysgonamonadaceae bacterium]